MSDQIPDVVRALVLDRAKGRCERCLQRGWLHLHHRKQRSLGGLHTAANLVALCPRCHHRIHEQEEHIDPYGTGWLLRSWQDPEKVPVQMPRGWVALFDSGDARWLASVSPRVARPAGPA